MMDNYVWREELDDILSDVLNEHLSEALANDLIEQINRRIDDGDDVIGEQRMD